MAIVASPCAATPSAAASQRTPAPWPKGDGRLSKIACGLRALPSSRAVGQVELGKARPGLRSALRHAVGQ
jgi:hypothetical protein